MLKNHVVMLKLRYWLVFAVLLVSAISANAQNINEINPDEGERGETLTVGISGSQFNQGTTTIEVNFENDNGEELITNSIVVYSSAYMEVEVKVPFTAEVGYYDVIHKNLWNNNQTIVQNGFSVDYPTGINEAGKSQLDVHIQSLSARSEQLEVKIEGNPEKIDRGPILFTLYNVSGQKLLEKRVNQQSFQISTSNLPSSQFLIYTLRTDQEVLSKGKIASVTAR